MNTESAANVLEFVHVTEEDEKGRPTKFLVPGHHGERYEVSLTRQEGDSKSCVRFVCMRADGEMCKGCQYTQVCYHVLASLQRSVQGKGHLVFFDDRVIPTQMEEMGRRVVRLENLGSKKVFWAVYFAYPVKKRKSRSPAPSQDPAPTETEGAGERLLFPIFAGPYN